MNEDLERLRIYGLRQQGVDIINAEFRWQVFCAIVTFSVAILGVILIWPKG